MLIYRIENTSGAGAFRAGLAYEHDAHRKAGCRSAYYHPSPYSGEELGTELSDLFMKGKTDDYHFGCRSKSQLRSWFRSAPGRRAMAKAGGVVVTYEAPREAVALGKTQVAFDINRAAKVSSVPADQW
ncbi:MAG: hypothetical protein KK482_09870 [Sinorhizobium meliloti]|nr:hypothetical protein [Sinorhizobium meliloti]